MTELDRIEGGQGSSGVTVTSTTAPIVIEYPEIRLTVTEEPVTASCPFCHQSMVTEIDALPGPFTMLCAVIMAHCLLCWVPFLVDTCKDVKHNCPKCKSTIGIFRRL